MQATRRVVTGHDEQGKAIVLFDGPAPNMKQRKAGGNVLTMLWVTDENPTDMDASKDRADRQIGVPPPASGTILRVVGVAPAAARGAAGAPAPMCGAMGVAPAPEGYAGHANTHRTRSIDYAIVLNGEIDMLLDDSEIHVKAGDVLVQQGTNHAWVNNSGKPCRIAFILIDAKEPAAWKK